MATFLDQYNLLLDMYHGCHSILKDLDKFLEDLKKIVDPKTVQADYMGADVIFGIYKDLYNSRSKLREEIIAYLNKYDSTLSSDYPDGKKNLEELSYYLNILDQIPQIQDMPFRDTLPQKQFDVKLVKTLRDPLMQNIRLLAQSDSSGNKSGVATKPTNVTTSNAKAAALMDNAASLINNPVVASAISPIKNTDVRAIEQATITSKKQQAVQQKNVLSKLADGTYLSELANTASTPSWVKSVASAPDSISNFITDSMGRYTTRNLVLFDTLGVSSGTQQQDNVKAVFREQTRKKYGGNLGFCDEVKDENGNWVLKKDADAKKKLSDSRKKLRNKVLGSITN